MRIAVFGAGAVGGFLAAHLARASQALRRGDVAGAAVAVPGITAGDSFTTALGLGGSGDAATRVLTPAGGVPTATTEMTARRSPWTTRRPWGWAGSKRG